MSHTPNRAPSYTTKSKISSNLKPFRKRVVTPTAQTRQTNITIIWAVNLTPLCSFSLSPSPSAFFHALSLFSPPSSQFSLPQMSRNQLANSIHAEQIRAGFQGTMAATIIVACRRYNIARVYTPPSSRNDLVVPERKTSTAVVYSETFVTTVYTESRTIFITNIMEMIQGREFPRDWLRRTCLFLFFSFFSF